MWSLSEPGGAKDPWVQTGHTLAPLTCTNTNGQPVRRWIASQALTGHQELNLRMEEEAGWACSSASIPVTQTKPRIPCSVGKPGAAIPWGICTLKREFKSGLYKLSWEPDTYKLGKIPLSLWGSSHRTWKLKYLRRGEKHMSKSIIPFVFSVKTGPCAVNITCRKGMGKLEGNSE